MQLGRLRAESTYGRFVLHDLQFEVLSFASVRSPLGFFSTCGTHTIVAFQFFASRKMALLFSPGAKIPESVSGSCLGELTMHGR